MALQNIFTSNEYVDKEGKNGVCKPGAIKLVVLLNVQRGDILKEVAQIASVVIEN